MAKRRESRQTGWLALLAWGSLGLASGCSSSSVATTQPHDPLHGIMTPPGVPQPSSAPKSASSTPLPASQGGVAALPASLSSTNNATLAGTSWQGPLGRPTPIDNDSSFGPPFLPGQSTLGSKTQQVPGSIPPNPSPRVEPVPDTKPINAPVMPTGNWQAPQAFPTIPAGQTPTIKANAPPSGTDLVRQLQDRGVINQKQDVVPEGIRLTCYLARPEGGFRVLEVTAADYPSAAQAILRELNAQ